jgi:hypothetical protein
VFFGLAKGCNNGGTCDPGHNEIFFPPAVAGTNFYEDADFNNLTDALTNRIGTPNCAGFTNTAACVDVNFGVLQPIHPWSMIWRLHPRTRAATATNSRLLVSGWTPTTQPGLRVSSTYNGTDPP